MISFSCFSCGKKMEFPSIVGRGDECSSCGADAHVCLNCQHYDRNSYNECRESAADVVQVKDRSNFCDHFTPRTSQVAGAGSSRQDLKSKAEALFGGTKTETKPDDLRSKAEDLFKKK